MKREQNHVDGSLPKKLSGPKYIVCHHCGAFGHLRPHCSKFQALERIKRKEKLELLGSCAMKAKTVLGENGKLLKKVFDVLTSLSICISGSYSSNPRLTSHETLISNNRFVWMRKGSYGYAFALLDLDLILSIFVGPFMHWMSYLYAFCAFCFSLYVLFLFWSYFYVLVLWVKYPIHAFCASCISLYAPFLFWSYFYVLVLCE